MSVTHLPKTAEGRIVALARSFPCLAQAPLEPWDAVRLADWTAGASHGERVTVQFVLSVWNPEDVANERFSCGRFDVQEALRLWDEPHRAAFLAWANEPWWT